MATLWAMHFILWHAASREHPVHACTLTALLHQLLLQVLWSSVVGFAEVKPELSDTSRYEEAVGQLMDRVQQLFQQQPERSHALGAVFGRDALEVFHFQRSTNQIISSGKLDLSATDGATMLLRMF